MAEVAGVEPATGESLCIGLGIVEIAGEHGGAAHADLAGLAGRQRAAVGIEDGDLHAGARIAAASDRIRGIVVDGCAGAGGSTVMLPVTSPRPKYCTSTGPSLRSACTWSARYIGAPA